jgi:hypothetical protein
VDVDLVGWSVHDIANYPAPLLPLAMHSRASTCLALGIQ